MPLRAIKLFYTVAFYPVSRARLRAAPVIRASPRFLSREGGRSAISTPFANLNSLSLAALIATPGGTRKLVLHRVKCLLSLSLSLFVSSFSFREILSLSLSISDGDTGLESASLVSLVYRCTRGIPSAFFTCLLCRVRARLYDE